ncbi:MAG: TIR domain-containing protein [Methylovirgula sp.]
MPSYDAFISYSHAKDKRIAAALQAVVQTLGKPWYKRRGLRLFRDDTSLSATPHLWPSIEAALGQSRFLILLASPEAASSLWVGKEVTHWLEHNSIDTLLIAVTEGELAWDGAAGDFIWSDATPLPPGLRGKFSTEPKWVDLRQYRENVARRDRKFMELGADFAAAIRGVPKEDLLSEELQQQRRALTLAWSAVGLLLVLGSAAAWQWKSAVEAERVAQAQTHIAQAQKQRAEKDLGAAKHAVDGLIFDIAQGLGDISGMQVATIRHILDTAKTTIDALVATEPGDKELQRSREAMLFNFADTYLKAGDLPDAKAAAVEALAIARELAKDKGSAQAQRDLSVSLDRIGDVKLQAGDLAGALAAYEEDLAIARTLAKDKGNAQAQRDLSVSLDNIGDVKLQAGDRAGALAAYEEELAICRDLAKDKGNALAQRDLSISLNKIGHLKLQAGDRAGALAAYEEELAICRDLAKDKGNALAQRDLSISLDKIGDVKLQAGDLKGALAAYEEELAILRKLAKDKENAQAQRDLSISLEKIGDVKLRAGDSAGALAAYEEDLAICRELAKDKGNAQAQRDLSVSLERIGDVKLQAGDRAGALAAYEEGLAIHRVLARDKGNAQAQTDFVRSLVRVALLVPDPAPLYREALATLEELDREGRLTKQQQAWRDDIKGKLAGLQSKAQ